MVDASEVGPGDLAELSLATIVNVPIPDPPMVLESKTASLPFAALEPAVFERLQLAVAREVRGLRNVKLYGVPGQRQHGIDIVGDAPDGLRVCVQCKRYETFSPADLARAVAVFDAGALPFVAARFVVAVPVPTERTEFVDLLIRLNDEHPGLQIELYGRQELSDDLRRRWDIVSQFFGDRAAQLYCVGPAPEAVDAPRIERAHLALAAIQGPLESTGAISRTRRADERAESSPLEAAEELAIAQQMLRDAGFSGHADVLTGRRAQLLGRAGRLDEAARALSDQFWGFVDSGEMDFAPAVVQAMQELTKGEPADATSVAWWVAQIAIAAFNVDSNPLGGVDEEYSALLQRVDGTEVETARLAALLAAQSATTPFDTWRERNVDLLRQAANALHECRSENIRGLELRLRLEIADVDLDWRALLARAKRRRLPRSQIALIFARFASAKSQDSEYDEADSAWEEAIEQSVLDGDPDRAADWVYSRRVLMLRLGADLSGTNDLFRLAQSLRASATNARVSARLMERAMTALLDERLRAATLLLRRQLRAAHRDGEWGLVSEARRHLARAYERSGELEQSVLQLAMAGDVDGAGTVAEGSGDRFLNVIALTTDGPYWVRAAAFRSLSKQADLIPDAVLNDCVDTALAVLDAGLAGTLRDSPNLGPHLYNEAYKFLASIASRTTPSQAERLLNFYEPFIPRELNHYRFTDDSHVDTMIEIALAHERLRFRAVQQLLGLLHQDGVGLRVERRAQRVFELAKVTPDLELAAREGSAPAARLVATMQDDLPADLHQRAAEAADLLRAPLSSKNGAWAIGSGAVQQSLLAQHLPKALRRELVVHQFERVESPDEPTSNRCEYLVAAANLSDELDDPDLFDRALDLACNGAASRADFERGLTSHPLAMFRFNDDSDIRPPAFLLAAALARTSEQWARLRANTITTARINSNSDYYVARALQRLTTEALANDVQMLASQPSPNLRMIAALTWARGRMFDEAVGSALARDPDQRVRRMLAEAIRDVGAESVPDAVVHALASDPRSSVRTAITQPFVP